MHRKVLIAVIGWSIMSSIVTMLVLLVVVPPLVEAQVASLVAQGLTVQRADGLAGITADVKSTGGGELHVLAADGQTERGSFAAGGMPDNPATRDNANLIVDNPSGDAAVRVGYQGQNGSAMVALYDSHGNLRYRAAVDTDGNPTVQLFDATGDVIWSAPAAH